jgi:ribosomal-protein-alanine N-acetyltransferase
MTIQETKIQAEEIFRNLPVLETERIKLRKLSMRDANDIFEYCSDPEVAKYVTWNHHRSVADSMHFLRQSIQNYNEGKASSWAIVYKNINKVIGTAGFHDYNAQNSRAEMGYALSSSYWNQGIVTEAVKEIIRFGFGVLKLSRIEAKVLPENIASEKVMLKCGMKYEGFLRKGAKHKDFFVDIKLYSIIEEDLKSTQ